MAKTPSYIPDTSVADFCRTDFASIEACLLRHIPHSRLDEAVSAWHAGRLTRRARSRSGADSLARPASPPALPTVPPLRARPAVEAALIGSWAARITEISCYADVQHTIELPAHA